MPDYLTMIIVSIFALIANWLCLFLLQKSKSEEAHMKASLIFTSNDLIINIPNLIIDDFIMNYHTSIFHDLIINIY